METSQATVDTSQPKRNFDKTISPEASPPITQCNEFPVPKDKSKTKKPKLNSN